MKGTLFLCAVGSIVVGCSSTGVQNSGIPHEYRAPSNVTSCKAAATNPFCQEDGKLFDPILDMAMGNKHILIMAFHHTGPKEFFLRERQAMVDWIKSDSSKVSILTELYSCKNTVLEIASGAKITGVQIEQLANNRNEGEEFVRNVLGSSVSSRACQMDVDGLTLRPAYVVERNRDLISAAGALGLACQWNSDFPTAPSVVRRSGDLVTDDMPAASQVFASLNIKSDDWTFKDTTPQEIAKINSEISDDFVIAERNRNLLNQAAQELQSRDRVIVPWGAEHLAGLKVLLEKKGFKVEKRFDVFYADSADQNLPPALLAALPCEIKEASPRIGNCIAASKASPH